MVMSALSQRPSFVSVPSWTVRSNLTHNAQGVCHWCILHWTTDGWSRLCFCMSFPAMSIFMPVLLICMTILCEYFWYGYPFLTWMSGFFFCFFFFLFFGFFFFLFCFFFFFFFVSTFDMDMHFKSALLIWMPFYVSTFDMGVRFITALLNGC